MARAHATADAREGPVRHGGEGACRPFSLGLTELSKNVLTSCHTWHLSSSSICAVRVTGQPR
jgi:hypothetical protein